MQDKKKWFEVWVNLLDTVPTTMLSKDFEVLLKLENNPIEIKYMAGFLWRTNDKMKKRISENYGKTGIEYRPPPVQE